MIPYISIMYISIIILPMLFVNALAADAPRLDTPNNLYNYHLVVNYTLTVLTLGLTGCLYVFYRIYKQWILNEKALTMIYKLPFYTAITGEVSGLNEFNFFTVY